MYAMKLDWSNVVGKIGTLVKVKKRAAHAQRFVRDIFQEQKRSLGPSVQNTQPTATDGLANRDRLQGMAPLSRFVQLGVALERSSQARSEAD